MSVGLGALRLSPGEFWTMTLPELNAAVYGATGIAWTNSPLSRRDLGTLMERFPDTADKGLGDGPANNIRHENDR